MELYLPPVFKKKRPPRFKINWTPEMIQTIHDKFPNSFNKTVAKELGISESSLHVKARALGIKKEDGFLEKNRKRITEMATTKLKSMPNPYRGLKGWSVPGSEPTRFKKGNISVMTTNGEVVEKSRNSRLETIRRERLRIKIGLQQKTKLKLLA